jgi:CBS domain-containing protein
MRMAHVGTLVVVEGDDKRVPLGILTDRDIVLSIVASNPQHLPFLTVGDAMSDNLVTTRDDASPDEALKLMEERGVRRLPIVDGTGTLVGILSVDDVVRFLSDVLGRIVGLMSREDQVERRYRV